MKLRLFGIIISGLWWSLCCSSRLEVVATLNLIFKQESNMLERVKDKDTSYYQLISMYSQYYQSCKLLEHGIQFKVEMPHETLEQAIEIMKCDEGVENVFIVHEYTPDITYAPINWIRND